MPRTSFRILCSRRASRSLRPAIPSGDRLCVALLALQCGQRRLPPTRCSRRSRHEDAWRWLAPPPPESARLEPRRGSPTPPSGSRRAIGRVPRGAPRPEVSARRDCRVAAPARRGSRPLGVPCAPGVSIHSRQAFAATRRWLARLPLSTVEMYRGVSGFQRRRVVPVEEMSVEVIERVEAVHRALHALECLARADPTEVSGGDDGEEIEADVRR